MKAAEGCGKSGLDRRSDAKLFATSSFACATAFWPRTMTTAAKVALAANWQGRFAPVHDALFEHGRSLGEAKVRAAAEKAGADLARLDSDLSARGADLQASLGRAPMQAHALALQGTPAFVIGSYLVPGAMTSTTC